MVPFHDPRAAVIHSANIGNVDTVVAMARAQIRSRILSVDVDAVRRDAVECSISCASVRAATGHRGMGAASLNCHAR